MKKQDVTKHKKKTLRKTGPSPFRKSSRMYFKYHPDATGPKGQSQCTNDKDYEVFEDDVLNFSRNLLQTFTI